MQPPLCPTCSMNWDQSFERETGHKLVTKFTGTSLVKREIDAGNPFDVVISSTAAIDDWIKAGKLVPATRAPVAYAGLGVGVRSGAQKPDISSIEASKHSLLNAKSVAHGAESASAAHFKELLDRLGIAADIKPRLRPMGAGATYKHVASGEVEMVVAVVPGIINAPGVELVGALPPQLQSYISFAAGVSTAAEDLPAAVALIKFLGAPSAVLVIKAKGMEPGAPN